MWISVKVLQNCGPNTGAEVSKRAKVEDYCCSAVGIVI